MLLKAHGQRLRAQSPLLGSGTLQAALDSTTGSEGPGDPVCASLPLRASWDSYLPRPQGRESLEKGAGSCFDLIKSLPLALQFSTVLCLLPRETHVEGKALWAPGGDTQPLLSSPFWHIQAPGSSGSLHFHPIQACVDFLTVPSVAIIHDTVREGV